MREHTLLGKIIAAFSPHSSSLPPSEKGNEFRAESGLGPKPFRPCSDQIGPVLLSGQAKADLRPRSGPSPNLNPIKPEAINVARVLVSLTLASAMSYRRKHSMPGPTHLRGVPIYIGAAGLVVVFAIIASDPGHLLLCRPSRFLPLLRIS